MIPDVYVRSMLDQIIWQCAFYFSWYKLNTFVIRWRCVHFRFRHLLGTAWSVRMQRSRRILLVVSYQLRSTLSMGFIRILPAVKRELSLATALWISWRLSTDFFDHYNLAFDLYIIFPILFNIKNIWVCALSVFWRFQCPIVMPSSSRSCRKVYSWLAFSYVVLNLSSDDAKHLHFYLCYLQEFFR